MPLKGGTSLDSLSAAQFGNLTGGLNALGSPDVGMAGLATGNFSLDKTRPAFSVPGVVGQTNPGLGGGVVTGALTVPGMGTEWIGNDVGLGPALQNWRTQQLLNMQNYVPGGGM
jgi:hypothetical protein